MEFGIVKLVFVYPWLFHTFTKQILFSTQELATSNQGDKSRILRNMAFRVHSKTKKHEYYDPLIAIPKLLDDHFESTYSDACMMNMNIDNTIEVLEEETDTLAPAVDNTAVDMEIVSNLDP